MTTIEVQWLSRAQCELPPAPLDKLAPRPANVHLFGTTVHYTDTPDGVDPLQQWRQIHDEAVGGGLADRYVDTPYNAGAARLRPGVGAVLDGRPNSVIGAHARPFPVPGRPEWVDVPNLYTLGIAMVGTNPTPEALAAIKAYLYVSNLGLHAPFIFPHSFWDPTACPSDAVRTFLVDLHSPFVHLVDR